MMKSNTCFKKNPPTSSLALNYTII